MKVKFSLAIQPDKHTIAGEVIGYNVMLVASVRTPEEARQIHEWISQALKEKASALPKSSLILPWRVSDL